MLRLSQPAQWLTAGGLALLLAATRGHHFASFDQLPSAAWAVFFLAGVYIRNQWFLAVLLAMTLLLDLAATDWGATSSYCMSASYVLLAPAYASLWLAGHLYARYLHRESVATLLPLMVCVLVGAVSCELISSGSFYFFSNRFAEPTFAEFGERLLRYFPGSLQTLLIYLSIALGLHLLLRNTPELAPAKRLEELNK